MTPSDVLIRRATAAAVENGQATERSQRAVLASAAAILEEHSPQTADHSDDVVSLCEAIALRLEIPDGERPRLLAAAHLHDIGKVTVPPSILDKPGALDAAEWAIVREHTVEGERILESIPEFVDIAGIVRSCHERWDGGGYPDGLAGEQIPLAARVVFCADAFDAMRCDRPYRPGRSAAEALAEIEANAGTQFDPRVAAALIDVASELRSSAPARRRALSRGRRSRRALALLLTLAIAGSASAATRVGPIHSLFHGGSKHTAAAPNGVDARSRPASDAGASQADSARSHGAAKRPHIGRRHGHRGGGAPGAESRSAGSPGSSAAGPASSGGATPGRRAAPGHGRATHPAKPHRTGRPESPGRSGEAPGRPAVPGKPPKSGGPGRSEEAPGHTKPPSATPPATSHAGGNGKADSPD